MKQRQINTQRQIADFLHDAVPHCNLSLDFNFINVYPANLNGYKIRVYTCKNEKFKHCIVYKNEKLIKEFYTIENMLNYIKNL